MVETNIYVNRFITHEDMKHWTEKSQIMCTMTSNWLVDITMSI